MDFFLDIMKQGLHILKIMKELGIVHRDIKNNNILIKNGKITLIDYGFAIILPTNNEAAMARKIDETKSSSRYYDIWPFFYNVFKADSDIDTFYDLYEDNLYDIEEDEDVIQEAYDERDTEKYLMSVVTPNIFKIDLYMFMLMLKGEYYPVDDTSDEAIFYTSMIMNCINTAVQLSYSVEQALEEFNRFFNINHELEESIDRDDNESAMIRNLLNLKYDALLDLCETYDDVNAVCKKDKLWILKINKDFGKSALNDKPMGISYRDYYESLSSKEE
jgi:serine/threonine protein kinase